MMRAMSCPSITVYGIAQCDSVKKSRSWFAQQALAYRWHDFKKQGLPEDRLEHWLVAPGWQTLLNRQGSSWRKLTPEAQAAVCDAASARALLRAQPTLIKRPLVEWQQGGSLQVSLGFVPQRWQVWLELASCHT